MEQKNYLDLIHQQGDENARIEQVKTIASEICKRRRRELGAMEISVRQIEEQRSQVNTLLTTISSNIDLIEDKDNKDIIDSIRKQCSLIVKEWDLYIDDARKLLARYRNEKVKIVSFGPKSQGKSMFTQLYTQLEDDVVKKKGPQRNADQTGAVNIIHHEKGVSRKKPKIIVTFKKKESVVRQINGIMDSLGIKELNGVKRFLTIDDIVKNIGKDIKVKITDPINKAIKEVSLNKVGQEKSLKGDAALISALSAYFEEGVILDELGEDPKPDVPVSKLPLYNDMQSDEKHYPAVDKIDIYVDLERNDLFENFEIGDTKGSSTMAGGELADKEIFDVITNSDAAFSIALIKTGKDNVEYYNKVIRPYSSQNESFKNRHFVIANVSDSYSDEKDFQDNFIKQLEITDVSSKVYIGSFVKRPVDVKGLSSEIIDPKIFADCVILDMLESIANNTKYEDEQLILRCNNKVAYIKGLIQNLRNELANVSYTSLDYDAILIGKIQEYKEKADKELSKLLEEYKKAFNYQEEEAAVISPQKQIGSSPLSWGEDENTSVDTGSNNDSVMMDNYQSTITSVVDFGKKYMELKKEKKNPITIFGIITGVKDKNANEETDKEAESENQKESKNTVETEEKNLLEKAQDETTTIEEEISSAVKYLFKRFEKQVKMRPNLNGQIVKGNANNIGSFIDQVCEQYQLWLIDKINRGFTPQKIIDISDEKTAMFTLVWKEFHLDKIIGDFSIDKLELDDNPILLQLKEVYKKNEHNGPLNRNQFFTSYDVLKQYFSKVAEDTCPDTFISIVNKDVLEEAITDAIAKNNLPEMIVDRIENKFRTIHNTQIDIHDTFKGPFEKEILPIYSFRKDKLRSAGIIGEEDEIKLKNDERWKALSEARAALGRIRDICKVEVYK